MNFWDTSALVALSVEEPHRQTALRVLDADEHIVVWWGTSIEYVAAISRRERDGSLTTDEVAAHLSRLNALSQVWYEVQQSRRAGQTLRDEFRSGGQGPEMVVVPAGSFLMGCVSGQDCWDYELPVHEVKIAQPFAVGKYEVTFAEWDACVTGGGCNGYRPDDEGWGRGRRPVINVSWEDARAYT